MKQLPENAAVPSRAILPVGLALVLALISGTPLAAEIFYVAPPPSGSDSNSGSQQSPWATLQHAVDSVQPGDSILVREGEYTSVLITTSGTADSPITLKSFPGEKAKIVLSGPVTPVAAITLQGASHFVIEGFYVDAPDRVGVRLASCGDVVVRGMQTEWFVRMGILAELCDDLLIESNEIASTLEHGIYIRGGGDRPVIRGNTVITSHLNGLYLDGDPSMGGDGVISNALIEGNTITFNGRFPGGDSEVAMAGVRDSILRNNLIKSFDSSCITLFEIDGGQPTTGNRVLNNTIIASGGVDGWALNIRGGSTGTLVRNNVLYNWDPVIGSISIDNESLSGFSSDHNVGVDRWSSDGGGSVVSLSQWQAATGQDGNSIAITQVHEVFQGYDQHLRPGSPAVDRGELLALVEFDLDGNPRPIGLTHDIGCYEGTAYIFSDGFESGSPGLWNVFPQ